MSEWISVEERLPDEEILVYAKMEGVFLKIQYVTPRVRYRGKWMNSTKSYTFDDPEITHWIPLSEPPIAKDE